MVQYGATAPELSPMSSASWTITIPGVMRGKGRPRLSARNGMAHAHTDEKTRNAEAHIRQCVLQQVGQICLEGPLRVSMHIAVQIPESWPKKRKASALAGGIRPTSKPDLDNCIKLLDALNGIAWRDDSQIVEQTATKVYGPLPVSVLRIERV